LFGPTFPGTCLSPDQPGYGEIVKPGTGKRRRRAAQSNSNSAGTQHNWTVISPSHPHPVTSVPSHSASTTHIITDLSLSAAMHPRRYSESEGRFHVLEHHAGSPIALHNPYADQTYHQRPPSPSTVASRHGGTVRHVSPTTVGETPRSRYSPYPSPPSTNDRPHPSRRLKDHISLPPLPPQPISNTPAGPSRYDHSESVILPPIMPLKDGRHSGDTTITLPPISSIDERCGVRADDSGAVLNRLRSMQDSPVVPGVGIGSSQSRVADVSRQLQSPASSHHLSPPSGRIGSCHLPPLMIPSRTSPTASSTPSSLLTSPKPMRDHSTGDSAYTHLRTASSQTTPLDDARDRSYRSKTDQQQEFTRDLRTGDYREGESSSSAGYHLPRMEHTHESQGSSCGPPGTERHPDPTRHSSWRPW